MRSPQATTFHATLAAEAKSRNWLYPMIPVDDIRIRVVRSYNYLGRRITDTGNDVQHAKTRAAMSAASVRQFASIYGSKKVALRHKTDLCNSMYTLAQLMYAYSTMKGTDKRTAKVYSSAYLLSWKSCIGKECVSQGLFLHMTEDDILNKVAKPSWTTWGDAARLRMMMRVAQADSS
eukprot:1000765-Amphidinium_carterae.1